MKDLPNYAVLIDSDDVPDATSDVYEHLVEADIGQIFSTVVGRAILAIIKSHGMVIIEPYTGDVACQGQSVGGYNALGYGRLGMIAPSFKQLQVVQYSPQHYAQGYATPCSQKMGWDGDELLCHEIFHAARRLGSSPRTFDGLDGDMAEWDDEEEFFAILVANIYSSETKRPNHLRANHSTGMLMGERRNPEVWLGLKKAHYDLVEQFCNHHTGAAPMMKQSPAAFNPIRTYYEWKSKRYTPKWGSR